MHSLFHIYRCLEHAVRHESSNGTAGSRTNPDASAVSKHANTLDEGTIAQFRIVWVLAQSFAHALNTNRTAVVASLQTLDHKQYIHSNGHTTREEIGLSRLIILLNLRLAMCIVMHTRAAGGSSSSSRDPPTWATDMEGIYSFCDCSAHILHWVHQSNVQPHQQRAAIIPRLCGQTKRLAWLMSADQIAQGG